MHDVQCHIHISATKDMMKLLLLLLVVPLAVVSGECVVFVPDVLARDVFVRDVLIRDVLVRDVTHVFFATFGLQITVLKTKFSRPCEGLEFAVVCRYTKILLKKDIWHLNIYNYKKNFVISKQD